MSGLPDSMKRQVIPPHLVSQWDRLSKALLEETKNSLFRNEVIATVAEGNRIQEKAQKYDEVEFVTGTDSEGNLTEPYLLYDLVQDHKKIEMLKVLNNALYEALPSGDVDAFELIKLIGSHYENVAEVLG